MKPFFLLILASLLGGTPNSTLGTGSTGSYSFPENDTEYPHRYPNCNIIKNKKIAFTSSQATDTLQMSIVGKPCYDGILEIKITRKDGLEVYKYKAPFKPHIAVGWDDVEEKDAEELIKRTLNREGYLNSRELPSYEPSEKFYEKHYNVVTIPKEQYEKLRKQSTPLFSHSTNYESWVYLVYDDVTGKVIIIMKGGV